MIQNDDYVEFDLKSLFFYILRQWKTAVIFCLVCAVLLGGFQAYTARPVSVGEVNEDEEITYSKEYARYLEKLDHLNERIAYAKYCVDNFEDYMRDSVRQKIDYQNANTAKASYYIEYDYTSLPENLPQVPDKTSTLVWLYSNYLLDNSTCEDIAAAVGMEGKYLPELITIATPTACTLSISVYHTSLETAGDIMDLLQEKLQSFYPQLSETIGNHSITCTMDTLGVYVDHPLHLSQNDTRNHLVNLQNNLDYYEYELETLEEPVFRAAPVSAPTGSPVKVFVKWAVIGGIVGLILAVVFLFAKSILRNRLHSVSQLVSVHHATVLGEAVCSRDSLSGFCKKINELEGCLSGNSENNYRLLAENIRNYSHGAKNILLCSDSSAAVSGNLAETLGSYLPEIHLLPAGDLLTDAAALHTLTECDSVILVSQRDHSRNTAIRKTLTLVQSYGKEVVGFIVAY